MHKWKKRQKCDKIDKNVKLIDMKRKKQIKNHMKILEGLLSIK